MAGTAPEDYRDPTKFFARTCFTRALREHAGMVLRRLAGKTENTAPVLTLITQFGGGKTHTLTALYHLVRHGTSAADDPGVVGLLQDAGLAAVPDAKVGVFVGNAWDPQEGRETPWIDFARQLAGDTGVTILGTAAKTTPPGTEALGRLFQAAGGVVLILFDEVLNFLNRHRGMAESFHAFIQNLTVATTGTTRGAAVVSLPRSQVDKVAHLPELRFALGEPELDTTSIDNAAFALEAKAFFIRKVGSDGFQIRHQPTLKKVVSDRILAQGKRLASWPIPLGCSFPAWKSAAGYRPAISSGMSTMASMDSSALKSRRRCPGC
ncbi:MAG: hypothetical protein ACRERE_44180 [Candidatus Entotheonellia bacterium]